MKHSTLVGVIAASIFLALAGPILAAQPVPSGPTNIQPAGEPANPAAKCLGDLSAFNDKMATDGYWANIYPVGGFEVRGLVSSVTVLGQQGEQQLCEDMLSMTRGVYTLYLADIR